MGLTFDQLRAANVARCEGSFHGIDRWSPSDWMTAVVGEIGEAANLVKKLRRLETAPDTHRPEDGGTVAMTAKLATEIADAVIYLDLFAARMGIDLGYVVSRKFNVVSDRVGSSVRLTGAD
jgi:NTP pyrophosphatase (non-canonical NTP hydrolase)